MGAVLFMVLCVFLPSPSSAGTSSVACAPTWQTVLPVSPGTVDSLWGLAAVSATDVWAVGKTDVADGPLIEHWDGAAWTVFPANGTGELLGASAVSSDDVWGVGYDGSLPLAEHWDGVSWTPVPMTSVGTSDYVASAAGVSSSDVWAAGAAYFGSQLEALVEHWDGSAWTPVSTPLPGDRSGLNSIVAVSSSDVWAAGVYWSGSNLHPLAMHWDGTSWTQFSVPQPTQSANLLAITAVSSSNVWAAGYADPGTEITDTLVEHWDGLAWNTVPSAGYRNHANYLTGVAAAGAGDVWAVGYEDESLYGPTLVLVEHWDGSSLELVQAPNVDPDHGNKLLAAARVGQQVWAAGSYTHSAGNYPLRPLAETVCPVRVTASGFDPDRSVLDVGSNVSWSIPETETGSHTIADATGMDLFSSGPKGPGFSFSYPFRAAGAYQVTDQTTSRSSTVAIRMDVQPKVGTVTTIFKVRWASSNAPRGFVYDVQIKRPGSSGFQDWKTGQAASSATFTPDTGTGLYQFRSRLRRTSQGASGWSPAASITVTSR
jgi:plastocyanin